MYVAYHSRSTWEKLPRAPLFLFDSYQHTASRPKLQSDDILEQNAATLYQAGMYTQAPLPVLVTIEAAKTTMICWEIRPSDSQILIYHLASSVCPEAKDTQPAQLLSRESLRDDTSAVKGVRTERELASLPARTADCNRQHEQKPVHPVSAAELARASLLPACSIPP